MPSTHPVAARWHAGRVALRRLRERRGVSAVEFAVILPLLLLIMLGAFDLGNAFQQSMRLESAARAGAQAAFSNPRNTNAVRTMVLTNLAGIPTSELDIKVNIQSCLCTNGTTGGCDFSDTSVCSQPAIVSITVDRQFRYVSALSEAVLPNLSPVRGHVQVRLY